MMDTGISTSKDRECRSSEMTIGNTTFTVISVQSDTAREMAYDKAKRLVLDSAEAVRKSYQSVKN
jgi:hypothetical protein